MTKRQKAVLADEHLRIAKLSNKQLFDELLEMAGGDDFDGCMTATGQVVFDLLKLEAEVRLADWLSK